MKLQKHIYLISFFVFLTIVIVLAISLENPAEEVEKEKPVGKAEKLEFSLMDSYGREVNSQDYKGVPIFLEFGACW